MKIDITNRTPEERFDRASKLIKLDRDALMRIRQSTLDYYIRLKGTAAQTALTAIDEAVQDIDNALWNYKDGLLACVEGLEDARIRAREAVRNALITLGQLHRQLVSRHVRDVVSCCDDLYSTEKGPASLYAILDRYFTPIN